MTGRVAPNIRALIRDNLDLDSEVTEESDMQRQKHAIPKTSTDAGILSSSKPVAPNVPGSVRDNVNIVSNATEGSDLHS
jgi:hypothetical protein